MNKPKIGLSLDYETNDGFAKTPWYAVRENYCKAVSNSGGLALALPHDVASVAHYADMLNGLVVTGGAFDVPPSLYGDADTHETVVTKDIRTQFELGMIKAFLDNKKPILGICGGQQILAVALGGSLIQHIPDSVDNALEHEQPNDRHESGHSIEIVENSLLHRAMDMRTADVNTAHHQAVASVPESVLINAYAPDGVIEGIEYADHPFCLGVQWHPEYYVNAGDKRIFDAFVLACSA